MTTLINDALPETPVTAYSSANWSRWLRHACYLPWRTRRVFRPEVCVQIAEAVANAEAGHAGELMVIVEGHLPLANALRQTTRDRAVQLFGQYRVWDTELNSGILLYLNVCERRLEILADRGIHAVSGTGHWQQICRQMSQQLQQGAIAEGLITGITALGQTLDQYAAGQTVSLAKDQGNELPNQVILL